MQVANGKFHEFFASTAMEEKKFGEDFQGGDSEKNNGIQKRLLIFYILQSVEYLTFSFPNILTIFAVFKFEVLHSKPTNLLIGSLSFADSLLLLNSVTSLVALFLKSDREYTTSSTLNSFF